MYCNKCGSLIKDGNKFCSKCGNKVFTEEEKNNSVDNVTEIYDDNFKETINNEDNNKFEEKDIKKKPSKKRKVLKIVSAIILLIIIISGVVFRNNIKCAYYTSKYNKVVDLNAKFNYAEKAFMSLKNSSTKKMIGDSLTALGEKDVDSAEKKLASIKDKLSMKEYKKLASSIKAGKINTLCKNSNYKEALAEFEGMVNLGEDIKKNKNYDYIMLNICSDIIGDSVKDSKNILIEEDNMYYGNLDSNSDFDHIIQVKNNNSYSGNTVKVNLYAYKNGQYEQVDTKTFNTAYSGEIKGVYTCDKVDNEDKKAVYIYYEGKSNNSYCDAVAVIGVNDNKLFTIANIMGNEEIGCEDFNDDGIYEVLSKSTNDSGWFKVSWNGETPKKIAEEDGKALGSSSKTGTGSQTINIKTSDYIFSYSNTSYLSDYDLEDLDKNTLALARNEIFARHGYVFGEEPFVTYFNNKTWYTPNPNFKGEESELNKYEIENCKKIIEWEEKK